MSLESGHHQVVVYGAQSTFQSPGQFFRDLWRDIRDSRKLATMLAIRDLKAQYRQSIFGVLWLLIPPIAWTVGLTVLRQNDLATIGDFTTNVAKNPAYILISMALWQMFVEALRGPMSAFSSNRGILTKVCFPREALIVAHLVKMSVTIGIQFLLIAVACIVYQLPVTWTAAFLPVAIFLLAMLGTVAGLFLAPVGLLYKDIANAMQYIVMAGMIVTPVIFTMPDPSNDGWWALVVRWNPATPMLVTARELATGQALTLLPEFFLVSVLTMVFSVAGFALLRASMPIVIERWSA